MKEYTSSGGTDLHFRHMKACCSNPFLTQFESSIAQVPFLLDTHLLPGKRVLL